MVSAAAVLGRPIGLGGLIPHAQRKCAQAANLVVRHGRGVETGRERLSAGGRLY
ncbi:hypothetical protein HMPREF9371_0376 [Neisseria shayeganii 871]|uniref:Uncharacterized protein n=1 Tax=Neisseria shayeganii 871 TaxID=1032488 RepID=G4CFI7_9NEIS|nr:hypothetical protein HMPREF9371_0376 [Neisseria shayeganii 871]